MDLIGWISQYGAWSWVVAGLVLLGLELVVPGGVVVWMGVAAIVTGLASLFQPIGWPLQWALFGVLSLVLIFAWLRYARERPVVSDRPLLNTGAQRFVGREAVLSQAIAQGEGKVMLDDTVWRVTGPDLAAGSRVRIVGHQGAQLRVEPA